MTQVATPVPKNPGGFILLVIGDLDNLNDRSKPVQCPKSGGTIQNFPGCQHRYVPDRIFKTQTGRVEFNFTVILIQKTLRVASKDGAQQDVGVKHQPL